MEQAFTDNIHTARGNAEHEKVDRVRYETSGDRCFQTALLVWYVRVGLIGKCGVVEFLSDGTPYPMECKQGAKRKVLIISTPPNPRPWLAAVMSNGNDGDQIDLQPVDHRLGKLWKESVRVLPALARQLGKPVQEGRPCA